MYDFSEQRKFLRAAGANATELVMVLTDERRQTAMLADERLGFIFLTIHLDDYYPEKPLDEQLSLVKSIFFKNNAVAGVMHPINIPDFFFEALTAKGIPLAIENMDKDKPCGFAIEELQGLIERHKLAFVLDVQHAYSQDPSMAYAWDLYQMAQPHLCYLHVSGQNEKAIHSLVHLSQNAYKIVEFLGKILPEKKLPIILEGKYEALYQLKHEIGFLKDELGFL
jgi:hypothetical protein